MDKRHKQNFERIALGEQLLAIIIRSQYSSEGIEFLTPEHFPLQLACMGHPAGYKIAPHVHNKIERSVGDTQEFLYVKNGRIKIDFYDERGAHVDSRTLGAGDVILLASGGHGLEMLEPSEIIEVKQGPYLGDQDKRRFAPEKPQ